MAFRPTRSISSCRLPPKNATKPNKPIPVPTTVSKGTTAKSWFQPLQSLSTAPQFGILHTFNATVLLTSNNQVRQSGPSNVHLNTVPSDRALTFADLDYDLSNASVSVACTSGLGEGEVTSTTKLGKVTITLNHCVGEKSSGKSVEECTVKGVGAKSEGEIVTKTLKGELGEVAASEAYSESGLLLEPETGKVIFELKGECLGSSTVLTGSVAAEVLPVDVSTKILEDDFKESSGKPMIKVISVKTGTVKPKLELGSTEAVKPADLEMEFSENIEID